ncbi:MAG: hypothetical protein EBS06_09395, partial [Proteobacteria bacterium]|nr:hypothetical protein [Pseudomonadota bacterium]
NKLNNVLEQFDKMIEIKNNSDRFTANERLAFLAMFQTAELQAVYEEIGNSASKERANLAIFSNCFYPHQITEACDNVQRELKENYSEIVEVLDDSIQSGLGVQKNSQNKFERLAVAGRPNPSISANEHLCLIGLENLKKQAASRA